MPYPSSSRYLVGYSPALIEQVRRLIVADQLGDALLTKYPLAHGVRTDKALYDYVQELKSKYARNAGPLSKVAFDGSVQTLRNALGTHTRISRIQGAKLKAKHEIRVATVFKDMPEAFLRMIVVHELAHIKAREHDKAFYQLCRHMAPDYHQWEFDLRCYLCHLEAGGRPLWTLPDPAIA